MTTLLLPADKLDYTDLYMRWEQGNWSAMDLDFSQDKVDWVEKFDEFMRRAARWNYSLFFYGEDSVATNLAPYIEAAPLEEQRYFLATQQVDEARHAIFFSRFFKEVIGVDGDSHGGALSSTLPDLTWGFRQVFDRLDRMAAELAVDRSPEKLAQGIVLYHFIIEATLAQTGQHFIADYLEKMDVLPGFMSGMANVARDEQRHIAFGVKILADLNRSSPDVKPAVEELLREVLPLSMGVFVPPNWDERYISVFGETLQGVYATGTRAIEARLQAAGLPVDQLRGAFPMPTDFTPEQKADRGLELLRAGILGSPDAPIDHSPRTVELVFETMAESIAARAEIGSEPLTILWDFSDGEPWQLISDNGSTRAARGSSGKADVVIRSSLSDFLSVAAGRTDPVKAMVSGKLRPRGKPVALMRARKVLAAAA